MVPMSVINITDWKKQAGRRMSWYEFYGVPEPSFKTGLYPQYRNELVRYLREVYESCRELMDSDDKILLDTKRDYKEIISRPIEECTDTITYNLRIMYDAVKGEYEKYYSNDELSLMLCRNLIEVE